MKPKIFTILALLCLLALPLTASAINIDPIRNIAVNNGLSPYDNFQDLLLVILNALLAIAFITAIVFVVLSGYRMITSAGNEKQVEAAKQNLWWAIIGIVVIVLAYAILQLVVEVVRTGNVGNTP